MRLAALLSLLLLTPATVFAHEAKVTAEGMSEEFAISEAMRQIPKGSSVTDTSCRTQDVGMSTRYWCTLTYSDLRIKQPTTDGPALARPLAQRGRNALPDCLTGCLKSNYTSIACSFNRSAICGRS